MISNELAVKFPFSPTRLAPHLPLTMDFSYESLFVHGRLVHARDMCKSDLLVQRDHPDDMEMGDLDDDEVVEISDSASEVTSVFRLSFLCD